MSFVRAEKFLKNFTLPYHRKIRKKHERMEQCHGTYGMPLDPLHNVGICLFTWAFTCSYGHLPIYVGFYIIYVGIYMLMWAFTCSCGRILVYVGIYIFMWASTCSREHLRSYVCIGLFTCSRGHLPVYVGIYMFNCLCTWTCARVSCCCIA